MGPSRVGIPLVAALLLTAFDTHAFTYGSFLTSPCHEDITSAALREVRASVPDVARITPSRDEKALVADVPFDVADDMKDLAAVSLLVGVRDNDLKGRSGSELDQLALVHGDPEGQREHCLRPPGAEEPDGSAIAIRDCKAFITERMHQVFDALDASGAPDPNVRLSLAVDLQLRGQVDASLPAFYVRLGQAAHALQDGYSHTFRTADGKKITTVLDWVAYVNGHHDDARNGPAHERLLDACEEPDALHARNKRMATEATTTLVRIALDKRISRAEKETQLQRLLDESLALEAGCTLANEWCNAPEKAYVDASGCGCRTVGHASSKPFGWLVLAGAGVAVARRRRRLASAAVLVGALLSSTEARADEPEPSTEAVPPAGTPEAPPTPVEVQREVKEEKHSTSLVKLAGGIGGSIVDPAFAASLGARLRLSDYWLVGLDGELNWWYGTQTSRLSLGATNIYASIIARFPLRFAPVNLRSTAQVGTAIELLDLYGVPKGNVGVFLGLHPLGLEWKLSGALYLVVNPLGVALPVTQLSGAPFAYTQFRTSIGLELAL